MPGRRSISWDGISLQDGTIYKVTEIQHESIDNRELNIQRLGKGDGGKLIAEVFAPKVIKLIGTIFGTDIDNLELNIDNLKELLNRQEKNLDIEYSSGTRRYQASVRSYTIERKHYNLTFANWEAEFIVSNPPFGHSLDTSTAEFTMIQTGTGTYAGNYVFSGTRRPMPIIVCTINSEVDLSKITFRNVNTNGSIAVEYTYTAGDILRINTDDYTVTINGTAVDYTGSFPEFIVGGNDFRVELRCDSANVTLQFIYYALYL